MRFRSPFRLLAAFLAINGTLASPAVALAHGEAHEHAVQAHEAQGHSSPGTRVDDAGDSAATVVLAAEHSDHDAGLHSDCLARIGAQGVASIAEPRAILMEWTSAAHGPVVVPPRVALSPLGRAAPPDQPRAPPLV